MAELYPLKFNTIYKDKIWGGEKIRNILKKDFSPLPNCGETWEISGVEGNISVVAEGSLSGKNLKQLIGGFKGELVGKRVYNLFGNEFPLLIKFIDANDDLSIQVHPDDKLGQERHNSFGKTEMWYVLQADEGAGLITGFNKQISKEEYLDKFNSGNLTDILNKEQVSTGDVFYIPAGRVHTIGKGLMIAEIQQTSDITYRIYDFDRVDDMGNGRELHTEEALDAIDYDFYDQYKTSYDDLVDQKIDLCTSDYFSTQKFNLTKPFHRALKQLDSFVIYIILEGACEINCEGRITEAKLGDCILVPAALADISIVPKGTCTLLETYIPE